MSKYQRAFKEPIGNWNWEMGTGNWELELELGTGTGDWSWELDAFHGVGLLRWHHTLIDILFPLRFVKVQ